MDDAGKLGRQFEFENAFGYELTEDQVRSVKEIKEDMEKPQQ